jgi:hypothetical protein
MDGKNAREGSIIPIIVILGVVSKPNFCLSGGVP